MCIGYVCKNCRIESNRLVAGILCGSMPYQRASSPPDIVLVPDIGLLLCPTRNAVNARLSQRLPASHHPPRAYRENSLSSLFTASSETSQEPPFCDPLTPFFSTLILGSSQILRLCGLTSLPTPHFRLHHLHRPIALQPTWGQDLRVMSYSGFRVCTYKPLSERRKHLRSIWCLTKGAEQEAPNQGSVFDCSLATDDQSVVTGH